MKLTEKVLKLTHPVRLKRIKTDRTEAPFGRIDDVVTELNRDWVKGEIRKGSAEG